MEGSNLVNKALEYHKEGMWAEASKAYSEALKVNPDNFDALNLLGLLKIQLHFYDEAVFYIKKACELNPNAYFFENLGRAYYGLKKYDEAIKSFEKALEYKPDDFDAFFNMGLAYKSKGEFDMAIFYYQKALETSPKNPNVYFNIANAFESKDDSENSLKYYKKAEEFGCNDKNLNYFLSAAYLKLKNFEQGWKYYESRPSKPFAITTQLLFYGDKFASKPQWQGEDIKDKTLFVYYEAALGDSIMYARYFPILKKLCKKVLFRVQNDFVSLFEENPLGYELVDTNSREIDFDFHIPLMSIPYVLKHNNESDIPFPKGYLKANSKKVVEYKEKYFDNKDLNNKLKIGIKWQGNPAYDTNRIIQLSSFYKLFELPNTQFYSLQKGSGEEELDNLPKNFNLINLANTFNDFSDTAAAIENLDLVICNDTSVAHLAGAMGKKCWILLPYVSNWRWHNDFSYSPWYKSIELFKQTKPDDWSEVFEKVYSKLIPLSS